MLKRNVIDFEIENVSRMVLNLVLGESFAPEYLKKPNTKNPDVYC